ncbi:hypothetical protein ACFOJF_07755 [Pseudocitrobacter faecalis]
MPTRGEGQRNVAFAQTLERGDRLITQPMIGHQQSAIHIKCRQFCHFISACDPALLRTSIA